MDIILEEKIEDLINTLKKDNRLNEIKKLKEILLSDQELINKIKLYQTNPYDQSLKLELFNNQNYKKYKELENNIYFLTLEMNQILNKLVDRKGCIDENN